MSARIAAIVLAAGSSQRFGEANKLLEPFGSGSRPLVAHAVDAVLGARANPVVVVTGHQAEAVEQALAGRSVTFVRNVEHDQGMGRSIAVAAAAVPDDIDGVLIALGDMPGIRAPQVRVIIEGFDPQRSETIHLPVFEGRRGHPVLFGVDHLAALRALAGDRGARAIVDSHPASVRETPASDDAVLQDVDVPADLA